MIKLTDILAEILNTFTVEAVLLSDRKIPITDILNQVRALRKVTIVRNITPEDYPQKPNVEYTLVTMKFITRGKPDEDMSKIKEDILTSDMSATDLRVPGVRSFKFKEDTLKRM